MNFIHDDFLLTSAASRRLFHEFAAGLPIIDFHCHLDPMALAENRRYANIAQLWVATDPYKHRAMRMLGVPEELITGEADDRRKFDAWAASVPRTLGNPLHHWTALELARTFDIHQPLKAHTASEIWTACNDKLASEGYSARNLLARGNTQCICTSDRLLDDLAAHEALAASDYRVKVLPSLRADDAINVSGADFAHWCQQLGSATGVQIDGLESFQVALGRRLDLFDARGCRLADVALDDFAYHSVKPQEVDALMRRCIGSQTLDGQQASGLRGAILVVLGEQCAKRGWILQLHMGAQRATSTRLRKLAGPAGGYASLGNACDIPSLCRLLDDLEFRDALPRTILYPLNPTDYAALATLGGSYAQDGVAGKVQLGPAWWYNDHQLGIAQQLQLAANHGLLSVLIGMTTDSRSLLSMTRHEYFRRVVCALLGDWMTQGQLPWDFDAVGGLVSDISYHNPRKYVLGKHGDVEHD